MMGKRQYFSELIHRFPAVRVLCLGDIMVDRYVYGDVRRVSAEAPIPIMSYDRESVMLGAVGNVARNVVALGGHATIIAVVGDDDAGRDVVRLIADEDNLEADLVTVSDRCTTLKTRYVAKGQQILRADREQTDPLAPHVVDSLLAAYRAALQEADIVVLSDYAKGCLGDSVLSAAIRAAREAGKPVIADPKSDHLSRYDGVSLLKPNIHELQAATDHPCTDDRTIEQAARQALARSAIGAILVTRSEQGMTLVERGGDPVHFRDRASEVFDVSGAGDTALAVLALAIGAGAALADAAALANRACGLVVSKVGTAVVYDTELQRALQNEDFESAEAKIDTLDAVADHVARWRAQGARIGFTNGCFDLIHAGHVSLLAQAKAACDRLVVGLNSDSSVKRLKGPDRPINNETARAIVLASFSDVDAVILFDEDTPLHLIERLRPDVLIKGADYRPEEVVGGEIVRGYGGEVLLAALAPEQSTTGTIRKIKG